jgi:hypothetical protein
MIMNKHNTSSKRVGLMPSFFFGSPVALITWGVLAKFIPVIAALAIGLAVGMLVGRSIVKAL